MKHGSKLFRWSITFRKTICSSTTECDLKNKLEGSDTKDSFTYSDCDCESDVTKNRFIALFAIAIALCEWALKMYNTNTLKTRTYLADNLKYFRENN